MYAWYISGSSTVTTHNTFVPHSLPPIASNTAHMGTSVNAQKRYLWSVEYGIVNRKHGRNGQNLLTATISMMIQPNHKTHSFILHIPLTSRMLSTFLTSWDPQGTLPFFDQAAETQQITEYGGTSMHRS